MTFISLLFLWRINTSTIILKDFYYHHSFKLFFIKKKNLVKNKIII